MSNITVTDLLAVWGAFVATLVLLWDIYKWKTSGPQISFRASPNMNIHGDPRFPNDKVFIVSEAVNNGDRPTTITNLGYRYYNNWFNRLLRKPSSKAVIGNTVLKPIPFVLEPGTVWRGVADQEQLKQKAGITEKGILIFELDLSHSKRRKEARVRMED
jgi:hypothetical protein